MSSLAAAPAPTSIWTVPFCCGILLGAMALLFVTSSLPGAFCAWLVKFVAWISLPLSWPLGKVLDYAVGNPNGKGGPSVMSEEVRKQATEICLTLTKTTAINAMERFAKSVRLERSCRMDGDMIYVIDKSEAEIVMVYDDDFDDIVAIVKVEELDQTDFNGSALGNCLKLKKVCRIRENVTLLEVLKKFRMTDTRVGIVLSKSHTIVKAQVDDVEIEAHLDKASQGEGERYVSGTRKVLGLLSSDNIHDKMIEAFHD